MKKNLEHHALPTAEEIKLYQEGKLSPSRTHEIELLAEENPMLGDALEGYAALPLFASVPSVTTAITQQAASSGTSASVVGVAETGATWWQLNGWVIGIGVGVTATIAAIIFTNRDDANATASSAVANRQTEQIFETPGSEASQLNDNEKPNKELATSSEQLKSNDVNNSKELSKLTSAQPKQDADADNYALLSEQTQLQTLEGKEAGQVTSGQSPEVAEELPVMKQSRSSYAAVSMIHLQNYRIADYTGLRKSEWDSFTIESLNVPANYGNKEDIKKNDSETKTIAIPYLSYINKCITAYDKAEYKIAINKFNIVLEQYPDDINAQFYGGMSYYKHNQPVLALALFEKAEKNTINSFRDESRFYRAKCLKMLNRTEEANTIFQNIVEQNGFYSAQAKKELND